MAPRKRRLEFPQERLLADLAWVSRTYAQARETRENLIVQARAEGITAERVAEAAGMTTDGVDRLVKRRLDQASGS